MLAIRKQENKHACAKTAPIGEQDSKQPHSKMVGTKDSRQQARKMQESKQQAQTTWLVDLEHAC